MRTSSFDTNARYAFRVGPERAPLRPTSGGSWRTVHDSMPPLDPKPGRLILLCLALFSSTVGAAPSERRVVVDRFEGQGAAIPRAGVIQALEAEKSLRLLSVRLLE